LIDKWWQALSVVAIAMVYIVRRGASRSLPQFIAVRVEPSPNKNNRISLILERTMMLKKIVGWSLVFAMLVLATNSVTVEPEDSDLIANSHQSSY
jgi:hypothetical protein